MGMDAVRMNETKRNARQELERGCSLYCRWYETGEPQMDGGSIAYEMVSCMRQALSRLKLAEGTTEDELAAIRLQVAKLEGELQGYRILDAAGRIVRRVLTGGTEEEDDPTTDI